MFLQKEIALGLWNQIKELLEQSDKEYWFHSSWNLEDGLFIEIDIYNKVNPQSIHITFYDKYSRIMPTDDSFHIKGYTCAEIHSYNREVGRNTIHHNYSNPNYIESVFTCIKNYPKSLLDRNIQLRNKCYSVNNK